MDKFTTAVLRTAYSALGFWRSFTKKHPVDMVGFDYLGDYIGRPYIVNFLFTNSPEATKMSLAELLRGSGESVLPIPQGLEESRQIQKYMEHLNACFASDSGNVRLAELSAEVARLKGKYSDSLISPIIGFYKNLASLQNESVSFVLNKSLVGTKRLVKSLDVLEEFASHFEGFVNYLNEQCKQNQNNSDSRIELDNKKNIKFLIESVIKLEELYSLIQKDLEDYWIYIPSELKEIFISMAQIIFMNSFPDETLGILDRLLKSASKEYPQVVGLSKVVGQLSITQDNLARTIFLLERKNKSFPKLELDKVFGKLPDSAHKDVTTLVKKIKALGNVEEIKLLGNVANDFHTIRFEIQISQNAYDEGLDDDIWEKAERLAFRTHSRLRELTGEKWYFNVDLVTSFSSYSSNERVIIFNHAEPSRSLTSGGV